MIHDLLHSADEITATIDPKHLHGVTCYPDGGDHTVWPHISIQVKSWPQPVTKGMLLDIATAAQLEDITPHDVFREVSGILNGHRVKVFG